MLEADPYSGHLFVFRGRRGDLIKMIWWDGQGACLFSKRLERGRFVWPSASGDKVVVTPAQLSMLLEGIHWRAPRRIWRPHIARQDLWDLSGQYPFRHRLLHRFRPPVHPCKAIQVYTHFAVR